MSGILEQILAELQAIKAILSAGAPVATQPVVPATQPVVSATQQVSAAAPADPFGLAAPAATAVTDAMVMGLIEPHLDNAPLKAGLQAVLAQMGIARLPEARPDQLPALYTAFQQVIAQFSSPPAGAALSIV